MLTIEVRRSSHWRLTYSHGQLPVGSQLVQLEPLHHKNNVYDWYKFQGHLLLHHTILKAELELHTSNFHLHKQISETTIMYLVEMWTNTMTTFWNMSTASAPIHITATSMKYWIRADTVTQPPYGFVLSIPITNTISTQNRAMQSWMWNLVTSRSRSFLGYQ